jgi:ABC-type uncharacterized transport system substrate-binding protein
MLNGTKKVWKNRGAAILLLCLLALLSPSSRAEGLAVTLLLSDSSAPYQTFFEILRQRLPASIKLVVHDPAREGNGSAVSADLVVAAGMKAAEAAIAAAPHSPVLAVMVPKAGYDSLFLGQKAAYGTSAIYLDQPWERQVAFLYAVLPDVERVGLLYSSETRLEVSPLLNSVANRGGSVVAQSVQSADRLFASLEKVLSGSDVLLAIPDSRIYNAASIRNILLTSYRHEVPLIGLSQGYVNAGALAAIFTLPEQIAEQTARQIIAFDKKKGLAAPGYPENFTVALNNQVARSLEIRLPSEDEIRKRMRVGGEGR